MTWLVEPAHHADATRALHAELIASADAAASKALAS